MLQLEDEGWKMPVNDCTTEFAFLLYVLWGALQTV